MLLSNLNILATAPGGVARVRELILTLAVQGKLVPQDPKDESASALLKKIRAEKDRLIAEGKTKRDKPLLPIADEEKPFELPQGWEWARLGTIGNIFNGNSINASEKEAKYAGADGLPYIATKDLGYGFDPLGYENGICIPLDEDNFKIAHEGAVLICAEGGSAGKKCGVTDRDICFGNKLFANEPYGNIAPRFLLCVYLSQAFRKSFTDAMTGIIGGVSIAKFVEIPIPLPSLTEQSRIVTRVKELMCLCDALETKGKLEATQHAQLVSTLLGTLTDSETPEQLADNWRRIATHFDLLLDRPEAVDALEQTILQLAVRGLLVPQDPQDEPASELLKKIRTEKDKLIAEGKIRRDKPLPPIAQDEQPFALPLGWKWVPLQHVGYTQTGTTPDKKNPGMYGDDIPFIKPGDIYPNQVDYENEALSQAGLNDSGRIAPAGSLLMVCIGTIGKSNLIDRDCSFNQQINSITPLSCLPEYIKYCCRSPYFQSEAWARSQSTTIAILNKGKWEAIPIALPPLAEQSRIVTRVASLRRLCADLRQRLTASQSTQAHLAEALVQSAK